MPLYEFNCHSCKKTFEQITQASSADYGHCPVCHSNKNTQKLISRFAVGGQGDLRESTFHGCHDGFTGVESATTQGPTTGPSGHVHGPGCSH